MRDAINALRGRFHGAIVTPADPGYEGTRVLFNTQIRTRPALLCRCRDTADVVEAVRFASDNSLPVSVRGGGHHACGFCLAEGGVVVDVGALRGIDFDPATGTV